MAQKRQVITLLTDFGTTDYFVGAMKYADADAGKMLEDDAQVAAEFDRLMRDGFRGPQRARKQA